MTLRPVVFEAGNGNSLLARVEERGGEWEGRKEKKDDKCHDQSRNSLVWKRM